MGRKPGSMLRATCTKCGCIELRTGCTTGFRCSACRAAPTLQYLAHRAVANAIAGGSLKPPATCACVDCGVIAEQYDHRDYNRPLDVEPVCRKCNVRRGPAVGSPSQRMRKSIAYIVTRTGITHAEVNSCELA